MAVKMIKANTDIMLVRYFALSTSWAWATDSSQLR